MLVSEEVVQRGIYNVDGVGSQQYGTTECRQQCDMTDESYADLYLKMDQQYDIIGVFYIVCVRYTLRVFWTGYVLPARHMVTW
jgi:hypothetical protein